MSRQVSPALFPEAPSLPSSGAQQSPSQSEYYDPNRRSQQLMTEEMMEDISTITETSQAPPLANGQSHILPLIQPGPPPTSASTPVTPQRHAMSASAVMQQQPFGAETPTGDGYGPDGSNKRKRSKVSRACDECRRKKIRCDATKDDGTVETCANCKRINASCTFSRVPMKRGPSKGYIKELSERVQQVEHQMENQRSLSQMGPPVGFRHSLDGRQSVDVNSPGIFGEGIFSPLDGPLSKKRTFSAMSEGAISSGPFAQQQFMNRDRMPSMGGWGLTATPQSYSGARFSIAIAPDQLPGDPAQQPQSTPVPAPPHLPRPVPPEVTPTFTKPFWTELQRSKGQAQQAENMELSSEDKILTAEKMQAYEKYLKQIHPVLPILPSKVNVLENHLRGCSVSSHGQLAEALIFVLCNFQERSTSTSQISTSFSTYSEFEDALWASFRENPSDRGDSDNFVLLWTCSLAYLLADNDLSRHFPAMNKISKGFLLNQMVEIAVLLISNSNSNEENTTEMDSDKNLARRNFNIVAILARLHSLGLGTEDPIPDLDEVWALMADSDDLAMMSDTTTVLAHYSNLLATVRLDNVLAPASMISGRSKARANHRIFRQQIRDLKTRLPEPMSAAASVVTQQLDLFLDLLSARSLSRATNNPALVFTQAELLADRLVQQSSMSSGVINPLVGHLFVLATLTFLEFSSAPDPECADKTEDPAFIALDILRDLLSSLQRIDNGKSGIFTSIPPEGKHWIAGLIQLVLSQHPNIFDNNHKPSTETMRSENTEPVSEGSDIGPTSNPTTNGNNQAFETTVVNLSMANDLSTMDVSNSSEKSVASSSANASAPNPKEISHASDTNGVPNEESNSDVMTQEPTSSSKTLPSSPPPLTTTSNPTTATETTTEQQPPAAAPPSIPSSQQPAIISNHAPTQTANKDAEKPRITSIASVSFTSPTFESPDFTHLGKVGWMHVLVSLTT